MPRSRRLLLAVLPMIALAFPGFAGEGPAPLVDEVRIEGTVRTHPDRIRVRLKTREGEPYDAGEVADDVRAIHAMRAFTGIRTEIERNDDGTIDVAFHVTELPYVGRIRFEGVDWWTRRDLPDVTTTARGSYLHPQTLEADRRALLRHFRSEQHLHVEVATDTTVDADSGIATVTFRIDLGHEVEVARTIYDGLPGRAVEFFIDQELVNRPGAAYQPDMVKWDAGGVAEHLRGLGYLDARIVDTRIEFFDHVGPHEERRRHGPMLIPEGGKDDRVVITFFIDAGPLYRLAGVRFVGNAVAGEEELRRAFGIADDAVFERREIDKAKRRALKVIRNRGYARARQREVLHREEGRDRVFLTLHIEEGRRYRIGRVDPVGNTVTKDNVLRRDVPLGPGDWWNDDAVERGERQLARTGLFKVDGPRPLKLVPYYPPDRPGEVDLRVQVEEDDTGRFEFQLGWSSSQGFSGRAQYREANFDTWGALTGQAWRGAGHTLAANAGWSEERTSFGINWVNPRVFDSPYFLSLGFQRSDSTQITWDEKRQVTSATVGRHFLDYDLLLSVGYSYTDLDVREVFFNSSNEALTQAPHNFHMNTVTFSQTFDRRNHPRFPTEGWRVEASQAFTGLPLSATDPYYRLNLEGEVFIPFAEADLGGVTYLNLRHRWQWLDTFGSDDDVPFYDRIFGGGPAPNHRGFDFFELGPEETNLLGIDARPGGVAEWLTTAEIAIPVQGTNRGFRGILFTDVGEVWGRRESVGFDELRAAAALGIPSSVIFQHATDVTSRRVSVDLGDLKVASGFGIRFPAFLPVALDFAWLLNPSTGEDRTQFHFSMSNGF